MGGQKIKNMEFKKYYLEPKKYINIAVNSDEDLLIVRFGNNETDKERKRNYTIYKNCVAMESIEETITDVKSELNDYYNTKELKNAIKLALEKLTKLQKQVIIEHFYNEKSLRQIARERGTSISTIVEIKSRALNNLRKEIINYQ